MRLLNNIIFTFETGYPTLLIHSIEGCPLNCMGCHNRQLPSEEFINSFEVMDKLKNYSNNYNVVLTGGEFLLNDIYEMIPLLTYLERFKSIVLYTNGLYPKKLKSLLEMGYIDSVHMDIKLPFTQMKDQRNFDIFSSVLGIPYEETVGDKMEESFFILQRDELINGRKHKFRTLKYPYIPVEYFEEIENMCTALNLDYSLNPFNDNFI